MPRDELSSGNPTLIRRKEASNLTFGLSMMVPRELSDEESDAMDCLDHILTGTMHSRIYGAARQKVSLTAYFPIHQLVFMIRVGILVDRLIMTQQEQLFDIIVREIKVCYKGRNHRKRTRCS